MTEHAAVFADPFNIAILAVVEVCHFIFLPIMGETKYVHFNRYAFNFDLFTA
jgi:hypothetical protein